MIILFFQTLIYGIIEGITEWIPVSSTGHLIIFESLWPMNLSTDFMSTFRVVIQLGAILPVILIYFKRLFPFNPKLSKPTRNRIYNTWIKIILGGLPTGIVGILLNDFFDEHFYNWIVVVINIIIYGILFVLVEIRNSGRTTKYRTMEEIPNSVAALIGITQVLALFPGTSRSGVMIISALLLGCSRVAAADYAFCMAIPIIVGSSGVKFLNYGFDYSLKEWSVLGLGFIAAMAVAFFSVRFFLNFIKKHNFKPFGIYRVVLGLVVIAIAFIFPGRLPGSERPSKYGLPGYVTENYIDMNEYSRPGTPLLKVNDIVIHYTANPGSSAQANRNYFDGLKEQNGTENVTYGSSNFIVGLDGEILAVVPINEIAYCSNNRNEDSISIETCHPDESGKFNEKTYDSLTELTAWLLDKYGLDSTHVIRHYDVTGKLCPLYYVENEDAWEQLKADVQQKLDLMHSPQTEEIEAQ